MTNLSANRAIKRVQRNLLNTCPNGIIFLTYDYIYFQLLSTDRRQCVEVQPVPAGQRCRRTVRKFCSGFPKLSYQIQRLCNLWFAPALFLEPSIIVGAQWNDHRVCNFPLKQIIFAFSFFLFLLLMDYFFARSIGPGLFCKLPALITFLFLQKQHPSRIGEGYHPGVGLGWTASVCCFFRLCISKAGSESRIIVERG